MRIKSRGSQMAIAGAGVAIASYIGGVDGSRSGEYAALARSAAESVLSGASTSVAGGSVAVWLVGEAALQECLDVDYLIRHVGRRLPQDTQVVVLTDAADVDAILVRAGSLHGVRRTTASLPADIWLVLFWVGLEGGTWEIERRQFSTRDVQAYPDSIVAHVSGILSNIRGALR